MFIPFQNVFNSLQTSYGVVGIKYRSDLFNLDSTTVLEKKQYYIYLDILQIIIEKKVIHGNEIAFILFHNLPSYFSQHRSQPTVLPSPLVTAHTSIQQVPIDLCPLLK